jgi:hypothetical protein
MGAVVAAIGAAALAEAGRLADAGARVADAPLTVGGGTDSIGMVL